MDTIAEFFQNIYDGYRDRIKSPFIGSFIISFLLFNWRVFAILFYSEWPIHCKIEWIEEKYCSRENLLYPIGIALFYILLLPYINLFFDWVLSYYSNKKDIKKKDKRLAELQLEKGEAKLIREIADAKAGISEINNLQERNESLQVENTNLTKQNQDDLDRHNKALEQFRARENDYKNDILILNIQSELLLRSNLETIRQDATKDRIKEMVNISEKFSEADKKHFVKFFYEFEKEPDLVKLTDLKKYEKLGLIEPITNFGITKTNITVLGSLLFEYLTKNLDLL